jgi:MFS transporter, UMF1 family
MRLPHRRIWMNDKKQIFGWAMYDWANSAYYTTVAVAIFPLFFSGVIVPENGYEIGGRMFSPVSLVGFMSSASSFFIFLFAPFLGAISDFSASKKKFLMVFCYGGSLFSILLYFCGTGDVWLAMIFFSMSQIGFVGGNIFYDAFLPQIASEDKLDWVSGKGFAFGYIGGGLQFALSLGLITGHKFFGIEYEHAVKLAMVMAGLWWAGFSAVAFIYMKETGTPEKMPDKYRALPKISAYARIGISRTFATAKKVTRFKQLVLFLIAYMIYNDAIQTVIKMAAIYGDQLKIPHSMIMITLLIVQFVAFFGALLFGSLAGKISAKKALMITLAMWLLVVAYGYFMKSATEYLVLGATIGIVMGGSQALSRSLYGAMIPPQASAEFYGFYSVFSKFSAIIGPAVFAVIDYLTGSARFAILSLITFFVVGLILLSLVNVEKAKEAKSIELF